MSRKAGKIVDAKGLSLSLLVMRDTLLACSCITAVK